MKIYLSEMLIGFFLAGVVLLVKISVSFTAPFIYQGF